MKSLVFVVVVIFSLLGTQTTYSSQTFTCHQIRRLVNVYGATALLEYARRNGYTEKQIALYKKCLRKSKKHG